MSGLCLVSTGALADDKPQRVGDSTRQWVELQKSGSQGSKQDRPMSGDVAQRSYQRYLRSFEGEIPAQFQQGRTGSR